MEKAPTRNGLEKVVVIVQAGVNAKDEPEEKEESHDSLGVNVIHWTRESLMLTAHEAKHSCQTIANEADNSQNLLFQTIRTLLHEVIANARKEMESNVQFEGASLLLFKHTKQRPEMARGYWK